MVLVHDRSHESSSIDLLEVGYAWLTLAQPFFSWLSCVPKFFLADLELGEKKVGGKKKVKKRVGRNGPDLRAQPPSPLFLFV
jgi:hypothetical protein